jgi:hypothetical protein
VSVSLYVTVLLRAILQLHGTHAVKPDTAGSLQTSNTIGQTYSPTVRDMDKVHDPSLSAVRTERRQGKTAPLAFVSHRTFTASPSHARYMQCKPRPRTYENVRRTRACTRSMYLSCAAAASAASESLATHRAALIHSAELVLVSPVWM